VALTGGRVPVRYMRVRRSEGWTRDDPSTGLEPSTERRELEVPAKVRSFQTRRYPGLGDAGAYGGPHGDLVVRFRVVDDPVEAEAVERVVEIGVTEALLGVTLPLATPQGRVRLVVPPCTSSGARLRLRGKGAGPGRPERDLLVEVRIVVPDALDSDTEALVRRLADRLAPPRRED
ncbi:MAG: hypothetical protein KDK70_36360, partial [Myxococcales bacterium]|nr:hypothetical protein [Myxococcales bacterium]